MQTKIKNYITCFATALFLFGFLLLGIITPDGKLSNSERRPLKQMPKFSAKTYLDTTFMSDFEGYTLDQFPMRDNFRTLKSLVTFYVFGQKDNHNIYVCDGYAAKVEYPLSDSSLKYAASRMEYLYNTYLSDKGGHVYLTIVPDKSYFLAKKKGVLSMDYEHLVSSMKNHVSFATYLDVMPLLSITDYYTTDTHWRQEKIQPVAEYLAKEMGAPLHASYTMAELDNPFYGVYYGQSALPLPAEKIYYMESPYMKDCIVTDYETGKQIDFYDFEKGHGKDPYELYLSGSKSLLEITNPNATTDKELIIFRDSFGSSISPYFAESYAKVTIVDIRYLAPQMLKNFIDFGNQDVLFLYSTTVLNNSVTMK